MTLDGDGIGSSSSFFLDAIPVNPDELAPSFGPHERGKLYAPGSASLQALI